MEKTERKCGNKGEHLSTYGTVAVINLQVSLQPLILLEEELQAVLKIKINLCGQRDDVR